MAITSAGITGQRLSNVWSNYWNAHLHFFKSLCIAAKINDCIHVTNEALAKGHCVVIGIQTTGDARAQAELERVKNLKDLISTAKLESF